MDNLPVPQNSSATDMASNAHAANDFSIGSLEWATKMATVKLMTITSAAGLVNHPTINKIPQTSCAYTEVYAPRAGKGIRSC